MNAVSELSGKLLTMLADSQQEAIEADLIAAPPRVPFDVRKYPLRHSWLRQMARSPAHALYAAEHGNDSAETLAMRMGQAGHAMLFGTPGVVVFPGKVRNGKAWDQFRADHADKVIVNQREHAKATEMVAAIHANPLAMQVLFGDGIMHEKTLLWEQNGRSRRSTPDAHTKSHVAELKFMVEAGPADRFSWKAARLGHHAQVADQCTAMETVYGFAPKSAYVVAVESGPPHVVQVYKLTQMALDMGRRANRLWLERFLSCEASGHFPGYCEALGEFDVIDPDMKLVFEEGDE
jgi:hypothetical protein